MHWNVPDRHNTQWRSGANEKILGIDKDSIVLALYLNQQPLSHLPLLDQLQRMVIRQRNLKVIVVVLLCCDASVRNQDVRFLRVRQLPALP
jgi:hypothetical protein